MNGPTKKRLIIWISLIITISAIGIIGQNITFPQQQPERVIPTIRDLKIGMVYVIESYEKRYYLLGAVVDYYLTVRDENNERYILFLDELPENFIYPVVGDKIMRTSDNIIKVP